LNFFDQAAAQDCEGAQPETSYVEGCCSWHDSEGASSLQVTKMRVGAIFKRRRRSLIFSPWSEGDGLRKSATEIIQAKVHAENRW